jgi:5-bromo-4-chloroindolyl phosphate hydrolysis protein
MRKDVQEALENAIAGFEKRQQAEQERLHERERFETDWAQIRTTVVLPALEEVAVVLRKAVWQCGSVKCVLEIKTQVSMSRSIGGAEEKNLS